MTKRLIVTFEAYDVVTVPFPFTDSSRKKKRPAVILSSSPHFNAKAGHSIMAMITSAKNTRWPLDVEIADLKKAGLPSESVVRMKLFTLDHRFVVEKIGSLSVMDRKSVVQSVRKALSDLEIG